MSLGGRESSRPLTKGANQYTLDDRGETAMVAGDTGHGKDRSLPRLTNKYKTKQNRSGLMVSPGDPEALDSVVCCLSCRCLVTRETTNGQ